MAKKHVLAYRSMEEAIKDGFKKIGGMEEAYRLLDKGNYAAQEHKLQSMKNQKMREMLNTDPRFKSLREEAKKKIG